MRGSTKVAVAAKIYTQRLEGETCAQMALNSELSRLDTWGRERVQPVVSVPLVEFLAPLQLLISNGKGGEGCKPRLGE